MNRDRHIPVAHFDQKASPRLAEIKKAHPQNIRKAQALEKGWPRPGVIDEPSHLYNEIQIQPEITNVMEEKRLVKINDL